MIYILKHFDTPLIRFELRIEKLKGPVGSILWLNENKRDLLPIGLNADNEGLVSWLRSRAIPRNRGYIEALLASMKLAENDLIGILNVCMGLSLNDCYWVVPEEFTGTFDDYNLYDNEFKKALSLIAYTGYGSLKVRGFTSSPEFTTNGMLRKGWRKINGKILLYKGGSQGAINAGNEPYCEFYAAQIARTMELNFVDYSLSSWKKSICSVCEIFTGKELSYVPIYRFGAFKNVPDVVDFLRELGEVYYNEFIDMMIFDALIYNTDRHQGNFGLLVDSRTNQPVKLAPIFDNGLGLFPYAMEEDLKELRVYANTRVSAFDVAFDDIAGEYISDRQRRKLLKTVNFRFVPDRNYNLPAKRMKTIEKFIQARARELLTF